MKLGKNLLAGLASSIWTAVIGLAVVPLYLKYLGIESYGLIGFFATTQALIGLLDMGMAPTINREVARCSALGSLKEAGKLLHTLAIIYWTVAGLIVVLAILFAPLIAEHWLKSKQLSLETLSHALMLMGLVVACRWPIGLYQGALMGAQRLTISSCVSIVMVTFGNLGAVVVLAYISPTIEAFFIWQAGVGLVYAATMRWAAWRVVGRIKTIRFDAKEFKRVWRFSAALSGVALSAIILTQLDKIILSKMISLAEFGQYTLATVVVGALYILILPMFNIVFPRLSTLVVTGDVDKLTNFYRLSTRILATLLFPVAMILVVFGEQLVLIWTGNQRISMSVSPIISLLAIGSALHGVMYLSYALQLAYGMTKLPLIINTVLTIVLVPLIIFFALHYGVLGGAMAWLLFQILYLLFGTWLTHRYLLKDTGVKWLLQDVGIPFVLSVFVGLAAYYLVQETELASYVKLLLGCGFALITIFLSIIILPRNIKVVLLNNISYLKKIEPNQT